MKNNLIASIILFLISLTVTSQNKGTTDRSFDETKCSAIEAGSMIWLGTTSGVVCRNMNGDLIAKYKKTDGLADSSILSVAVDPQGNKWFGTNEGGVSKFNGTTWVTYNSANSGLASNHVYSIAIDAQGNKWFGTAAGVSKFDGTTWTTSNTGNSGLADNNVNSIAIDVQGNTWLATSGGVNKLNGTTWTTYNSGNSGLADNAVSSIGIDPQGDKWFGTLNGGVNKLSDTSWSVFNSGNSGLADNAVLSIAFDNQGNKLFGTAGGGVSKLTGTAWTTYNTSNSGLAFNRVESIAFDGQGNSWYGTAGGVNKYNGNFWATYSNTNSSLNIIIINNNETLHVDITGVTNLTQQTDPMGNLTTSYTYRRSNIQLEMTIRPHITIVGGSCVPNGYFAGVFNLRTRLVTGFQHLPAPSNMYWPVATPSVDSLSLLKATGTMGFSGQIDFTRHYKSQHSLTIQIHLFMTDVSPCPTNQSELTLFLYPEATTQEMAMTTQANASGSDQAFWKQGNCNACTKKGVPGFGVSTVTLLPGFSDQDYAYSSLGPDPDFSRYFSNPGIMGMFGEGWNFAYEQELLASKKMVQYQNGTGANEVYNVRNDTVSPYTYEPTFSNRKKMLYYPAETRFEIFDPETKLFSDLQLYATDNDTMRFHLTGVRDMNGNTVNITFNGQHKISAIADAAGRTTLFQYGAGDRCAQMILPDGRACSYQYTASGQLMQVTDIYGNDVGFTYDSAGYIASMRVNQDMATFTYYTGGGHRFLTSVQNLDGNTTQYYPDVLSTAIRWNRITDPSGKATMYEIDAKSGSTTAKKDVETGARQQMSYNANKMLTDLILPSGDASKTVYDSLKRVIKKIDYRGIVSTFFYDSLDNMIEYIDANNHSWKWLYNQECRITKTITPLGKSETFTYYPNGLLKTHTFGTSQTYTYAYDQFGNISSIIYPTGGVALFEYDEKGLRCNGYTDPEGNHSTYEFDALDRITQISNPDGSLFNTMYNCCAPTGTIDENRNVTLFERTPLLQVTKETNAEGNAWNFMLDGAGRVVETTRPDNTKYQYTYNSSGEMLQKTDPFQEKILFDYDLNGLVKQITDQSGNVTSFLRSQNGTLTAMTLGNKSVAYNLDSLSRITSFINSRGKTVNYAYNADGLIQAMASNDFSDVFSYDDMNRLITADNSSSTMSIAYNEMNTISQLTFNGNRQFKFVYDLNNDLTQTTYSDNSMVIAKRDNRGRITSMNIGADSAGFTYDAASNLLSIRRSNGINTLIRRNKINKIMALRLYMQTDTLMKWDYTRNAMGYITRESRSGVLCSDSVFMPADTGGLYQIGNQLSQWQNQTYDYDDDGNLIKANPAIFTAVYDNLNRLSEWTQDGGTVKAQYFYNAKGFVAKKQLQNGGLISVFLFFYDAENRVIEITREGTSEGWKFFYNENSLIACKTETGFFFYHYDHQGNTVAMSDRSGNIVKTYAYDAWGKILKETGSIDQPFKYSGAWGVMHEYNYLYRMPYRFYDSFTGKFLQRDPSGFNDGVNLYRYAANNPVNYTDPTGLIYCGDFSKDMQKTADEEHDKALLRDPTLEIREDIQFLDIAISTCELIGSFLPFGSVAIDAYADYEKKGIPDSESFFLYSLGIGKQFVKWAAQVPYAVANTTYMAGKEVLRMAVEDDVKPSPYVKVNKYQYGK